MGTLTQKEREGLDELFLSLQHPSKYKKIKEISNLIIHRHLRINFKILLKQANLGLKETKLSHFLFEMRKKKKNLSK